ncbi:uncharacterized protein TM35_000371440 [Trypanosoma theileri]|uniref:Uncharacterized protein n=1 Tax=Trypanosoma theileri TaxID=67003 RepID=A0A1X0NKR4_9TRYP|nr:uncharacterized protein TM35_000371440 [Trypanosoma theileri]ORC85171.1 hypothetical protein TM35_000371440 [Trypanosoma theileri]
MRNQDTAAQSQLEAALEKIKRKRTTERSQCKPDNRTKSTPTKKGRNLSSWAWKPESALPHTEERPKLGFQGIQELRQPIWTESNRPSEKIRTFEGMMEYLGDASPGEVVAAYRQLFPRPVNPGIFYQDAWNNFVRWLDSIRNEGISAQLVQMRRQIYTQLRVIQTA